MVGDLCPHEREPRCSTGADAHEHGRRRSRRTAVSAGSDPDHPPTGDRRVPAAAAQYMAEHIPGARYVELPGDDHLPFVGDQDSVLDEVLAFLTGIRPNPAS